LFIGHQYIRKTCEQGTVQNRHLAAAAGSKDNTGNILQLSGWQCNDAAVERMLA